jgi:hypothetical protein
MALLRTMVGVLSDIGNVFCNLKLPLLLLGCLLCNSHFPIIFAYFKQTDIIVDSIDLVGNSIFIVFGVISKAANYCLDMMGECMAILDKMAQASFDIGVLCLDRVGKLLKQRHGIMHQYFIILS